MLLNYFGKHTDLVTNCAKKKKNVRKPFPKKYSPALCQFALSLPFFLYNIYCINSKMICHHLYDIINL